MAFPCFDQPDLKARFTLSVTKPADWQVIGNTELGTQTKPISTYLFAFAAGPFEKLTAEWDATPVALWVRKSQVARAREGVRLASPRPRAAAWRKWLRFFSSRSRSRKHDQVLIPGFPYGGMEHAGATFLNEDVVLFRTAPTVNDYNRRAETVLHELAHQWFGDLVTMRWFDDLWLNECFAKYMAFHTRAELEPPGPVWKRFYESIKPLAYRIDGTRGTTPIYQQIANLKDAKSAYGAIVYQKAPSLLRLLNFNIGEDNFREGVRLFLKEHAYANAEWSDLIDAFSRASKTDLRPWADAWVKRRGMPIVETRWTCGPDGKLASLVLSQARRDWRRPTMAGANAGRAGIQRWSFGDGHSVAGSPERGRSWWLSARRALRGSLETTKIIPMGRFFSTNEAKTGSSKHSRALPILSVARCCGARCGTVCGKRGWRQPTSFPWA